MPPPPPPPREEEAEAGSAAGTEMEGGGKLSSCEVPAAPELVDVDMVDCVGKTSLEHLYCVFLVRLEKRKL